MSHLFTRAGPTALIIEETPEGCFLYSFGGDGFVGDTWHPSIAEAKEQATQFFGKNSIPIWTPVPESVTDLADFARRIPN
jgi:hypothetical protein